MLLTNTKKLFAFSFLLAASNLAIAECSQTLSYEQLSDCIVAEGAGQSYEDYLEEINSFSETDKKYTNLPKKKQTKLGLYLTSNEASAVKNKKGDKVLFIDVRSRAEVSYLGMATVIDNHIPYMDTDWSNWDEKKKNYKMVVNNDFSMQVSELISSKNKNKSTEIILICRSGSRSAKATNLLTKLGYNNVYSVVDGYEGDKIKKGSLKGMRVVNGWKNNQLPWSYKLSKNIINISEI